MKHYLAIFTTIVLFSTIEVVVKKIGGGIDPIFLSFLRFMISGLLILLIDIKRIKQLKMKDFFIMTAIGFAGVTLALGAYHISLRYIEASKGAVIFSLNPVFTGVFAYLLYREKLELNKVIGIILGFAGVYILSFGFKILTFDSILGPVLMLIAAIFFALYIVAAKKYVKKYGPFFSTGLIFVMGSILYLPFIKSYEIVNLPQKFWLLAYLILGATGIAYVLYFYGLKSVPLVVGTSMFYIKPVIASTLAFFILGENLSVNFYIGLVIIFSALTVTIINFKNKKV